MSLAIIDTREWQNMFDLKSGTKVEAEGALVELMKTTLARHPYPGDMAPGSNRWVSDIALELIRDYDPRFVFLTYARQYFSLRYAPLNREERGHLVAELHREVERFVAESGFTPVIVGRGDMIPLMGYVDLSRLDGLAIATHWSVRYAGLHSPSRADLKAVTGHPHIERVVSRDEMLRLFQGTGDDGARVPDYLVVAERGYALRTVSSTMRTPIMIHDAAEHIPLHSPLGGADEITAIRDLIMDNLGERRIALIVLDGIGSSTFPWPLAPCRNGREWYSYEPGAGQYLAMSSGRHRVFDYPSGYKSYNEDGGEKEYPLSGYFTSLPEGTIGQGMGERSIAVGNNSMFMHMVTGADLCVECFARNLSNQGALGVIHCRVA